MGAAVDKIYEHKDKNIGESGYSHDGKYKIVSEARMKNPSTREWVDCIIYADIFDKVPAMRTVATNSFHLESEDVWLENIALAKTTDEKSALWTMLGYLKDEERAITEIYKLDPKSKHIDLENFF